MKSFSIHIVELVVLVFFSHRLDALQQQENQKNIPVCTSAYDQTSPKIISDGRGGAIIVWEDLRNGIDDDIYAQRINSC